MAPTQDNVTGSWAKYAAGYNLKKKYVPGKKDLGKKVSSIILVILCVKTQ